MKRLLEDVFVTEGVPEYTFIPPPNFNDILLDIRRPGKPVIIEGQSGTGKTTCVKKVMAELGLGLDAYLTAREPQDVEKVRALVGSPRPGIFIVDDFHRLPTQLQTDLADLAKLAAENASPAASLPKLILIGINQIGSDLIQLVPDIAKRVGIHRIDPGTEKLIAQLIQVGSEALSVHIDNHEAIYKETKGDYWLTQQLCQSICAMNDVLQTLDTKRNIAFELAALRKRVVDRLKSAYHAAVKEFCRGQRFRPSNDPYYKLLRAIGEQDSSVVDLNELANSTPDVRGSINNIKEKRLAALLGDKPICARHFYYNPETKNFALEDPALFYFMKHLDWAALRLECGFRDAGRDYEWDFALSFAGENRELARFIAEQLEILDARVFFDEYFEANFLGKAWSQEFKKIFADTSRLVVCLLDAHHADKIWPTFERDCFQPRVPAAEVIPIYLDETKFVGIPSDIVGIKFGSDRTDPNWKDAVIDKIVFKLIERLG